MEEVQLSEQSFDPVIKKQSTIGVKKKPHKRDRSNSLVNRRGLMYSLKKAKTKEDIYLFN